MSNAFEWSLEERCIRNIEAETQRVHADLQAVSGAIH